jgi:hypothetical protein
MNILAVYSDQLITWSDYARYRIVYFAQTSYAVAAANAGFGHAVAWLAHRALQALRQTWMQVCRWSRPWPQVLSIGELSRLPPPNGLRATSRSGRRRRALGKLSPGPRDHRGDLRDQPRTVASSRSAIRRPGEPVSAAAHPPHRSTIWRRSHCKHARSVAHFRIRAGAKRGDRR